MDPFGHAGGVLVPTAQNRRSRVPRKGVILVEDSVLVKLLTFEAANERSQLTKLAFLPSMTLGLTLSSES